MDDETSEEDYEKVVKVNKRTKVDKDVKERLNRPLFAPIDPVKSCDFCGVLETPQWRAGPPGKRNLCNA